MNLKDIAVEAGVSISTVSRVLNHANNVSQKTERAVLEVLERNQFTLRKTAQMLPAAKTHQILIIVPIFSNPFYSMVVKGILTTLDGAGWQTFVGVTEYSSTLEKKYMDMLQNKRVDGVISFSSHLPLPYLEDIASRFPYIQIGDQNESEQISSISINDTKAAYEATEYMIKKGHKRIGMLSDNKFCAIRREKGFQKAKEDYGLDCDSKYIVKGDYQFDSGFEFDSGIMCCEKLLALPEPPTALLATFDTFAVGAANCVLSRHLMPGKDIAIIGFDNSSITKSFVPSISTISHPRYEMGCLAANIMLAQIESGQFGAKKIFLPHELIIRESS